ncbi:hypothetical protein EI546_14720 [Aequorivita sp. H23M31]|uniref:Exo-alpha-sialidase n=1 Tax=Aequorivita ciconiae TaxID=2494375 RepID=A0A410G6U0_9FLAO|nr:hypothetical protein [Aequorivita sp. H23M31]QAA82895.1 hypothetical protein EI546_14720 [Aequorivita sp. H23M31]
MKLVTFTISLFLLFFILVSCKNETKNGKLEETKTETPTKIVSSLLNPTSGNSSYPRLFATESRLLMSWVQEDSISRLYYSILENGEWTKPYEVNSGNDWFISWADFPTIAENNGNILVNYLQNPVDAKDDYNIKINVYSAKTQTWKKDILLHNDGTASEHGFMSVVPLHESSFYVIWLDGRNTIAKGAGHGTSAGPAMSLRGRVVNADGTMKPSVELDNRVCDCCQTAVTPINGAPLLVYRDRSDNEIRDISRIRLSDDSFSKPLTVFNDNWKISGCPVSGPAIASFKNKAAVAWFTAVNNIPKVQLAFSSDGGETFGIPIQINNHETNGGVDVVMDSENSAMVSWIEIVGDEAMIQIMRVSADGSKGFPVTISKSSLRSSNGNPQLEKVGDSLYAAWTQTEGTKSSVMTASVSIKDL